MKDSTRQLTVVAITITLLIAVAVAVSAQTGSPGNPGQPQVDIEPDSKEFERFADALTEVQEIQQNLNENINQAIADSPLGDTRFREIHRVMQSPESDQQEDIGSEERDQYSSVMEEIQEIQAGGQQEMVETVEEHDMSVERFNRIIRAVQQSRELQEALQNHSS